MMTTKQGDDIMTLKTIEQKMTSILTKELNIKSDEFDIRFLSNDASFNVTLYTEDNQEQDYKNMSNLKKYFMSLGSRITHDIDVYICEEDGYIGTFMTVKK